MARRVFYSFHYDRDAWRASQVRNIGTVEGSNPVSDNDWERVWRGGNASIKRWIDDQLYGRSCTVVLIGSETADREWVRHEIQRSWDLGKGLLGIHIHGLKGQDQRQSSKGRNPFDDFYIGDTRLSRVVNTYDPPYWMSTDVYGHIRAKLADWVETALKIRSQY